MFLASFMQQSVFEVHPLCCMFQFYVPFDGSVVFHCMGLQKIVHLFTDGHLDCPSLFAMVNKGAVNTYVPKNKIKELFCR